MLLLYNLARFDNPFDFGYASMSVSPVLEDDLAAYGQFDLHFVPRNLKAMFLATPVWNEACRAWTPDPWGMSLLLTMPVLVYLPRAVLRNLWTLGAWAGIGLTLVPLLLYHSTGWYQFGYRFGLDFLIPVIGLLAVAAGTRLSSFFRGLIIIGIGVNLWGLAWFFEKWCAA